MRRLLNSLVAVLFVVSLAGCQAMTGKSASATVDDSTLTAKVKTKLVSEKAANFTRINVDTNNGIVYLNGNVPDAQQKAKAEELARSTDGVKKVINNLQVGQAAQSKG
ncbi:MAG TPA: BON domain-containing protein [Candidatus Binatia bacterium]|nr:BON domain-containing protein [Candidatus Binatia bacterium]